MVPSFHMCIIVVFSFGDCLGLERIAAQARTLPSAEQAVAREIRRLAFVPRRIARIDGDAAKIAAEGRQHPRLDPVPRDTEVVDLHVRGALVRWLTGAPHAPPRALRAVE